MNLSEEQLAVVRSEAPKILVSACAGSGKTRVLVERIKHLISIGVQPESICCVTFTQAAAKEIQARLQIKLGYAGTLHSLMLKAVRQEFRWLGYSAPPSVASEAVADELLDLSIIDTRCKSMNREVIIKAVSNDVPKQTMDRILICAVHYHQKLIEAGLIDYDGILRLGLRLVRADRFPFHFTHLICDEMQDSSAMDFAIYRGMKVPHRMYVGDIDQQIYGFRGACSGFEDLCVGSESAHWTLYKLQTCYRCSEEICFAADTVLDILPKRLSKETNSHNGPKGPVVVERLPNAAAEVTRISGLINSQTQKGKCQPDSVAVLLRTNALVRFYRDGLKANGIRIREQRGDQKMEGWDKAQSIIAYCCDPMNDHVAYAYAKVKGGDELASKLKRAAAISLFPIAELVASTCGEGQSYAGAVKTMISIGIPPATIEKIEQLHADVEGDLHQLLIAMREDDADQSGEGVYVGTMHSYKGREADDVYLPAFEDEVFPARRDLTEEVRLCYVAFTRARNWLFVSSVEQRQNAFTKKMEHMTPSRFIEDVPHA